METREETRRLDEVAGLALGSLPQKKLAGRPNRVCDRRSPGGHWPLLTCLPPDLQKVVRSPAWRTGGRRPAGPDRGAVGWLEQLEPGATPRPMVPSPSA